MPSHELPPEDYKELTIETDDQGQSEAPGSGDSPPLDLDVEKLAELTGSPEQVLRRGPNPTGTEFRHEMPTRKTRRPNAAELDAENQRQEPVMAARKRITEIDIALRILAERLRRIGSKKTDDAEQERTQLTRERIALEGERGKLWRIVSPVEKPFKK